MTRRHSPLRRYRALLVALTLSVGLGYLTSAVFASTIVVGGSVVYDKSHTIDPLTEMRPTACSVLTIAGMRNVGNGNTYGNSSNNSSQLLLGNAGSGTTISAGKGNDCIVPGGVANGIANPDLTINGGQGGGDVCYDGQGPGNYARSSCTLASGTYTTVTTNTPSGL
ncbi:MAG: hypothetical protein QOH73_2343 [Gaiellaceae bacterium]|jgi:hypothetical protein|nr:hypothetical protein [Gaiellaceae bacterium]